ncbi:MAG: hypothetical protein ACHQII_06160 [Bacteroidia bacterium]
MKKIFSLVTGLIVVLLIIISCKSGNGNAPQPLTTAPPLAPYGGQFQVNNTFNDNSLSLSNTINDSTGSAATILMGAVNVGTVSVNNHPLTFQYNSYFIATNIIAPVLGKTTWQVSGGSGFGAFTYTTTKNVPWFGNLHVSLSSFSKSGNLVITHPLIAADSIRYTINDNSSNSNMATKVVGNSSTGITFTPAMMASLVLTNNHATLQITGVVTESSIQGGKNVSFLGSSTYNKGSITITN